MIKNSIPINSNANYKISKVNSIKKTQQS